MQHLFLILLTLCIVTPSHAQPGDRPFSVIPVDDAGYANCSGNSYKIYGCTVKYPHAQSQTSPALVWQPDLSTLIIIDSLRCIANDKELSRFPFAASYQARSCLNTYVLLIIRNNKDSMFINAGGSEAYYWRLDPDGNDTGLPFIFRFQTGLVNLDKLHHDKSRILLHYSTYRDYLLAQGSPTALAANSNARINFLKSDKSSYHAGDTVSVSITGSLLNDGGCGGKNIIWTLQKSDSNSWYVKHDVCCTFMDCSNAPTVATETIFPIFILADKRNDTKAVHPIQLNNSPGTYRLIFYDDYFKPYRTKEFKIE